MWVLNVPEKTLAKEEPSIRRAEQFEGSDSWAVRQSWGKLRRLRCDRQGLADLRGAAVQYRQSFPHDNPEYLFTCAMMYLQAGAKEAARQALEQARALLEGQLAEGPTIDSGLLLDVLFLLGDGERAERALAELRVARPDTVRPTLRHPVLAELAVARSTKDAQRAADAVARLHALARGQRSSYTESGPATLWDLYEQALIVQAEVTGSAPPELREI